MENNEATVAAGNEPQLYEFVKELKDKLAPKYGLGEADAMVKIMFENIKGWTPVDMAIKANEHVSDFIANKMKGVVDRLLDDEPIQYIFGSADFYGMKLKVTPDVLIPRPETAELVDIIVKENTSKDLRVIDLGCGSGCISIALSRNLAFPRVTAVDISEAALTVARENAAKLYADVDFVKADILSLDTGDALSDEAFDLIVSNPPYIAEKEKSGMEANVLDHEPASALFVPDDDPLRFYRSILRYAVNALAQGGFIYFEINPLYVAEMKTLVSSTGFVVDEIIRDTFGKLRFMKIKR